VDLIGPTDADGIGLQATSTDIESSMSDSSTQSNASTSDPTRSLTDHAKIRLGETLHSPIFKRSAQLLLLATLFSGSALAQTDLGSIYCDTTVETGISVVFGAIIGLGLPATMVFVGRSGMSYMRSSGNPNQQMEARKDLILSLVGFGIVVLAIVSPELVDKFGSQLGIGFSDCVRPYTFGSS